jgi:glycosyltransferase involved in cell wall biosynthesis
MDQGMKKKILFVINTLSRGGAETSFLALLNGIDKSRYEVSVYVLLGQGELFAELPEGVHLKNKRFSEVSVLEKAGKGQLRRTVLVACLRRANLLCMLPYLLSNLRRMKRQGQVRWDKLLWQLLARGAERFPEHYDLAVAYIEGGSAYYVADWVQADKKAAFVHIDYGAAGYNRQLDRACYLRYDHVFAVSREGEASFLAAYPELAGKTSLFHNPVNMEELLEKSREPLAPGVFLDFDGYRLLTVGRLNPQKAIEVSIETMAILKKEGLCARWYVLGSGPERERLEMLIRQYGLENEFYLLGAVGNPYPYFAACDLYVHASRFEGRSVAIQEAQALGCAVLASDCSGNREQISDGVDGVLSPLEPEALAAHIRQLLENVGFCKRLGEQALKKPVNYPEDLEMLLSLLDEKRDKTKTT